jgi:hypothetical protein
VPRLARAGVKNSAREKPPASSRAANHQHDQT